MGNLTQCTICNSHHVDKVNDMLKNKVPYRVVVNFLKDKGIELSETSVYRHKKNHLKGDKKPRQIQKQKIMNAQEKAKSTNYNLKHQPDKILQNTTNITQNSKPNYAKDSGIRAKQLRYEKIMQDMIQDIDVINEMLYVLAVSKDRVERALNEESTSGLVLATTGRAIKDYSDALKNFNDITAGMDSLTKLRFAQLVQMMGDVFCNTDISDQARFELLSQMPEDEQEIIAILPNNKKKAG